MGSFGGTSGDGTQSVSISIDVEGIITAINAQTAATVAQTAAINAQGVAITAAIASASDHVKSLAIIAEYWHQLDFAFGQLITKKATNFAGAEAIVRSLPIIPAHNTVLTKIES